MIEERKKLTVEDILRIKKIFEECEPKGSTEEITLFFTPDQVRMCEEQGTYFDHNIMRVNGCKFDYWPIIPNYIS
jgi:hypothetical protein